MSILFGRTESATATKFDLFCAGTKIKVKPSPFQRNTQRNSRSKGDEAREILANTLLNHVPVVRYNFQAKVGRLTIWLNSMYNLKSYYIVL